MKNTVVFRREGNLLVCVCQRVRDGGFCTLYDNLTLLCGGAFGDKAPVEVIPLLQSHRLCGYPFPLGAFDPQQRNG